MTPHRRNICGVALACLLTGCFTPSNRSPFFSTTERGGRHGPNRMVTPVNQIVTPTGIQVDLPDMRPLVVALSPDGQKLLTSGKTSELLAVAPTTGAIRPRVSLPSEEVNEPKPEAVSQNILWP